MDNKQPSRTKSKKLGEYLKERQESMPKSIDGSSDEKKN